MSKNAHGWSFQLPHSELEKESKDDSKLVQS